MRWIVESVCPFIYKMRSSEWQYMCVSIILPLVSHVTRQSVACAKEKPANSVFTFFLITYAVSMLIHSYWIDTHWNIWGVRCAILLFGVTYGLCIWTNSIPFVIRWSLHAIPSAVFWPISYKYINHQKRSRLFLVVWSLQGNIGDAVGCVYTIFDTPWSIDTLVMSSILCSMLVVSISILPITYSITGIFDLPMLEAPSRPAMFKYGVLMLTIIAASATKTITYTASNWMPSLGLNYLMYNVSNTLGLILAGGISDRGYMLFALLVSAFTMIPVVLIAHLFQLWTHVTLILIFGFNAGFCSALLSICMCTSISEYTHTYGWTTSVIDGCATLMAAGVQLWAFQYFELVQLVSVIVLCSVSMLLKVFVSDLV